MSIKTSPFPWKAPNSLNGFNIEQWDPNNYEYNDRNPFQPLDGYRVIIHNADELPYSTG